MTTGRGGAWGRADLPCALFSLPDLKADEKSICTLPESTGSAPQEIDPSKENQLLFTYSVHWEVRGSWQAAHPPLPAWELLLPQHPRGVVEKALGVVLDREELPCACRRVTSSGHPAGTPT